MEPTNISNVVAPIALAMITQFAVNAIKGICAWLAKRTQKPLIIPSEVLPFFAGVIGIAMSWIYGMSQGTSHNKWNVIVTGILAGMGAVGGAQGQKQSDEIVKEAVKEEAVREK